MTRRYFVSKITWLGIAAVFLIVVYLVDFRAEANRLVIDGATIEIPHALEMKFGPDIVPWTYGFGLAGSHRLSDAERLASGILRFITNLEYAGSALVMESTFTCAEQSVESCSLIVDFPAAGDHSSFDCKVVDAKVSDPLIDGGWRRIFQARGESIALIFLGKRDSFVKFHGLVMDLSTIDQNDGFSGFVSRCLTSAR
jgi:hypothetical protein